MQLSATVDALASDAQCGTTADGSFAARCSLWWRSVPTFQDHRVGLIGHYAAGDASSGMDVLRMACGRLRNEGCTLAVGPLDGSTWRGYRFVTDRGAHPPFFLEPDNPDDWPAHFAAGGFHVLAAYRSALTSALHAGARALEAEARVRAMGVSIRALDLENVDAELLRLYDVASGSFAGNFLYTPISRSEFSSQYRAILPFVRPELVSIAEIDNEAIGFVFAVPDALEAARAVDGSIQTIVLKTLAVAPAWRGIGLGRVLFNHTNASAARLGYTRVIHALMYEGNVSERISGDARTIRRYSLFAKAL